MAGGTSAEFRCLSAVTDARNHLDDALAAHAAAHFRPLSRMRTVDDAMPLVRSDHAHNIARFFYVADELGLLREAQLHMLLDRHNADMTALLADRTRRDSMGLSPQRLEEAIFSPDQVRKIFHENMAPVGDPLWLDQSDLCKLLTPVMSPEICRQTTIALAAGGLLRREGYGRFFVTSPGTLERLYREYLALIVQSMREPHEVAT